MNIIDKSNELKLLALYCYAFRLTKVKCLNISFNVEVNKHEYVHKSEINKVLSDNRKGKIGVLDFFDNNIHYKLISYIEYKQLQFKGYRIYSSSYDKETSDTYKFYYTEKVSAYTNGVLISSFPIHLLHKLRDTMDKYNTVEFDYDFELPDVDKCIDDNKIELLIDALIKVHKLINKKEKEDTNEMV